MNQMELVIDCMGDKEKTKLTCTWELVDYTNALFTEADNFKKGEKMNTSLLTFKCLWGNWVEMSMKQ
jgi:hypothetical protein